MAVSTSPNHWHAVTRYASNVWIESSPRLPGTRDNLGVPYAVNWSLSPGVGCHPYPPLFLSTNFWIWWPDNAKRSFPNVPPIRLRFVFDKDLGTCIWILTQCTSLCYDIWRQMLGTWPIFSLHEWIHIIVFLVQFWIFGTFEVFDFEWPRV